MRTVYLFIAFILISNAAGCVEEPKDIDSKQEIKLHGVAAVADRVFRLGEEKSYIVFLPIVDGERSPLISELPPDWLEKWFVENRQRTKISGKKRQESALQNVLTVTQTGMDANRKKADCYDILLRFGDTESAIQREHNILGNPEIERGVRYISDYTLPPVLLLGHEGLRKLPVSLELTYKNKCVARKFGPDGDALVMLEVHYRSC